VQSRRDQVEAQSYVLGRLTSALVSAEPDAPETPHRRTVTGIVCGILVAALVAAGFAVYGFLVPGAASKWRQAGALIVERETGIRYLFSAGRLRPVLNYASARLLLGAKPKVVSVSAASLRGVPHGQPVGIVGAPDALPVASALRGALWSACARAVQDSTGDVRSATTLAIRPADQAPQPLLPGRAVVVRLAGEPAADDQLLWNGRRFRLAAPWLSKILGYAGTAVPVEPGWLDLLPSGVDIAPPRVPGRGEPGPTIDGQPSRIGQLLTVRLDGSAERHYLLQRDGLSQLTALGYAIASGDPDAAGGEPRRISLGAVARLPVSRGPAPGAGLPPTPPAPATPGSGQAWCAHAPAGGMPVLAADRPVGAGGTVHTGPGVARTGRTADAVEVAAGMGGLALAGTTLYLITDAGVKYPVAGAAARTLGYPPESAVAVAPGLLDLLPTGPALDPRAAAGSQ
jgi:type VII secretion protein EccB